MKKRFCSASVLILMFLSCSKTNSLSKTALLTATPWHCVAEDIEPGRFLNNQIVTDMYSLYDPCERDDYTVFNADGTYELNNGPSKCAPTDPQTIEGTWYFSDGETKLNLSPFNNYIFKPSDIVELNETTLKLVSYSKDANGSITGMRTLVFKH